MIQPFPWGDSAGLFLHAEHTPECGESHGARFIYDSAKWSDIDTSSKVVKNIRCLFPARPGELMYHQRPIRTPSGIDICNKIFPGSGGSARIESSTKPAAEPATPDEPTQPGAAVGRRSGEWVIGAEALTGHLHIVPDFVPLTAFLLHSCDQANDTAATIADCVCRERFCDQAAFAP
jgi:hypothetical protein